MKMFSGKINRCSLLLLFLFIAFNPIPNSYGQGISVTATVDKNQLTLEDTLNLSIKVQGTQNTPPPELPSLPDFRVLSAGTSSSTQIINFKRSVSITHNYRLTPMNTGTFIIGPTRLRAGGKTFSTKPITVKVKKPSSQGEVGNKNAYVEAILSKEKAYIGEQLVYTFRLYHRIEANNLDLKLPFNKNHFHKEELGKPKTYNKILNGLNYQVQELSLAIFPLKAGTYEILPSVVELDFLHRSQSRTRRDRFGSIFDDPLFGRATRVEHKVLRSQPLPVQILPLPDGAPNGFKNLIGQFDISAELGNRDLEVGDTSTLTITVSGRGNVRDISLDEPDLKNHFKVYPDKPEFNQSIQDNQIVGEKVFKFALVPLESGIKELPIFSIPYFDTKQGQYHIAETQPISLKIRPSSTKEELNLVHSGQPIAPASKPEIEVLCSDILPIYTDLEKFQPQGSDNFSSTFLGISFGSPLILFVISAIFIKQKNRMKHDVAFYRRKNAYKNATQRLQKLSDLEHSDTKEFGKVLSEILREYIGDKLNLQGKAITAEEVEIELKKSNYESAEEARKLLETCETYQFAQATSKGTKELVEKSKNLIKLLEKNS